MLCREILASCCSPLLPSETLVVSDHSITARKVLKSYWLCRFDVVCLSEHACAGALCGQGGCGAGTVQADIVLSCMGKASCVLCLWTQISVGENGFDRRHHRQKNNKIRSSPSHSLLPRPYPTSCPWTHLFTLLYPIFPSYSRGSVPIFSSPPLLYYSTPPPVFQLFNQLAVCSALTDIC